MVHPTPPNPSVPHSPSSAAASPTRAAQTPPAPSAAEPAPSVAEPAPRALYTARVDNLGGTSGQVRVHDGPSPHAMEIPVADLAPNASSAPEVLLPTGGPTTAARGFNPEQFLAMAWSTCLGETLRVVLKEHGHSPESSVRVEVDLHRDPSGGYRFTPRALVTIDAVATDGAVTADGALSADEARVPLAAAHARCPVSKLLSGPGAPRVELVQA